MVLTVPGDSEIARTLGVLLAGGRGERLGLGPKALLMLGGETLLARTRRTLAEACDEVVVVAPRGVLGDLAVVEDAGLGPLGGMVAAFASREFGRAVVLGVDFPFVSAVFLRELIGRLGGHDAAMPVVDGVRQPLVACYSASGAARIAAAWRGGERSVVAACTALDVTEVEGGAELFNLNGPGEWKDALARFGS